MLASDLDFILGDFLLFRLIFGLTYFLDLEWEVSLIAIVSELPALFKTLPVFLTPFFSSLLL
jgi:hypothetical protein